MVGTHSSRDRSLSPCAEIHRYASSYRMDYRRIKDESGDIKYSDRDSARDMSLEKPAGRRDRNRWNPLKNSKSAPQSPCIISWLDEKHRDQRHSSISSARVEHNAEVARPAFRERSSFFSGEPSLPTTNNLSRQLIKNRAAARSRSPEWSQRSEHLPFPIPNCRPHNIN
jgi:hypothetical protein